LDIIKHPSCTHSLGAPEDMTDEQCASLPVLYEEHEGSTYAISFWKPTETELLELNGGGLVTLFVRAQGRQHPVVGLGTLLEQ